MSDTRLHFVAAYGPKQAIRSFNDLVPIGTPCTVRGVETKTWSLAGYGPRRLPVVFVDAFEEPVGLHEVSIDGLEQVTQKRAAKEELRGKGHVSKSISVIQSTDNTQGRSSDGEVHQGKLF